MVFTLPDEIIAIITALEEAGYEAYAVGGAVRDTIIGRTPKDWDIATNALPEQIQDVFPDSIYENKFGTVTVRTGKLMNKRTEEQLIHEVEVTTYRVESEYTDNRRPDGVEFVTSINDDLARRDFTVNAMGIDKQGELYDLYNGNKDIELKLIRAVGDPRERFAEDALRLMRAVRIAIQLGFAIETDTLAALQENAHLLKNVSMERVRDEFVKIIESSHSADGVRLLRETGLLEVFLPEILEGYGIAQNKHHIYEVFEHLVRALEYATSKGYSLEVRLASLFHDIGKPRSKRGEGEDATFYNHEMIGADMCKEIMKRLRFSNELSAKVVLLVRYHQFYYQAEEVTATSVRRLVKNVGLENIEELLQVREADRIGSGVPKAVPYKLRHLKYMIEQVSTDPISPKMLKIKGNELISELGITGGPHLGLIINSLLAEVLDNPQLNEHDVLLARAHELNLLSDEEMRANLKRIDEAQQEQEEEIKRKYYVK